MKDQELPRFEKAHGKTEAVIRRRIIQAIFESRLPAGARITEEQLAATFDVSRTVVRQAMARLSQDGILVKSPNVGTTVASPTKKEARDILAVRRMVEPAMVRELCHTATETDVVELQRHLAREEAARAAGDRPTLVRLTGEFHLLLAEFARNHIVVRLMTQLQALTCLAILLYAEREDACPPDEHSAVVDAIARRDAHAAEIQMLQHLKHVENDLRLGVSTETLEMSEAIAWLRGG